MWTKHSSSWSVVLLWISWRGGVRDFSKLPGVWLVNEGSANQLGRFTVVTSPMNKAHRALAFMTSSEKQHYVPMQQSKEQWHATVTVEPVEHQSPIFWAACLHACRSSMRIRAVLAKNWCWIFLSDGLPAQNPSIWRRILWTHSMHSSSHHVFHYDACLVLCLLAFLCTLSEHTHNAHNQSTPSRCCEQLSLHFPQKRRNGSGNGEGSTSFKSAMFSTSSLCRSTPICQRRPPLAVHSRRHFERRHVLIHRIRLKKYAN